MTDFTSIQGIGKGSRELLEAAGFVNVEALAKAGVDELVIELERANRILKISKRTPTAANIASWIAAAREVVGIEDEPVASPAMPVNYEAVPEVMEMLAAAPAAIPLPSWQLMENHLAVSDIPPVILLNRYSGDLEIRVTSRDTPLRAKPRAPAGTASRPLASGYVQLGDSSPQRLEIDVTRLRSIADLEKVGQRIALSMAPIEGEGNRESERIALIRAPLEATNRGRDPRSRTYIRGVLHSHPLSITLGAMITLAMALLLPLAIAVSGVFLLAVLSPTRFAWASPWLLVVPCALPLLGGLYLIYAYNGRCRICNQRLFLHRACLKNSKAHRIRGLGYIVPLCLHIVLFRWFRCTYCGTPVRLKK
ncbi:MAG: DUF4332 domain-containing protein [Verrucomicrobiota bacterium]